MLFNSATYIIFFVLVFLLHYILSHTARWVLLLVASLTFYMWWKPELIIIILISTVSNFVISLQIQNTDNKKRKKYYLAAGLIINFTLLFIFKYLVFFVETISYFASGQTAQTLTFSIILPMGISFYTFQASAYTIDVYKGKIDHFKTGNIFINYLKFLLFITFFPQLVAGPIERAENLFPQLFSKKRFDLDKVCSGLKIALWGFFKKVVIADRAALFVNGIFNSLEYYSFLGYFIAVFLFAFQIYCDFSGYSDIAVGCSKMLGIDLMKNFDRPYFANNLKSFWRRWHISLSTWFKDYVYFPLGGSRVSKPRSYFNTIVTFLVSGLWHGANWTFVIWGALHGILQVAGNIKYDLIKKVFPNMKNRKQGIAVKFVSSLFTFSIICFLWIFFRANSVGDAFYMITHFFWGFRQTFTTQGFYSAVESLPATIYELRALLCAIMFLVLAELIGAGDGIHEKLMRCHVILRFIFYYIIIVSIFAIGVFSGGEQFIYFQF